MQQLVAQIPWGHNILIITKIKEITEAIFYINETIINGWSISVLEIQIETDLFARQGKAITNQLKSELPSIEDIENELSSA